MRVVFDSTFLLLLIDEVAAPPKPPQSSLKPADARDRIRYALEVLDKAGAVAIIPTPVLAELLAGGESEISAILRVLQNAGRFRIAPFDQRAAIECGLMIRQALRSARASDRARGPKATIKFDSQIISIAKTEEAKTIYSDDVELQKRSRAFGIETLGVWDLPARPVDPQGRLPLES